jgi:hypothetical protein
MSLRGVGQDYGGSSSGSFIGGLSGVFRGHESIFNLRLFLITLASVGLIFSFLFIPKFIFKSETPPVAQSIGGTKTILTEAQVLTLVSKEPITKDFISRNPIYDTKVTFLDQEMLKALAISAPAIYADLPKEGMYKVEYTAKDDGILLLLDPKNREVLKYYRVRKIQL